MPQLTLGGDRLHDDPLPFACAGCSRADRAWARTRISVANVLLLHHRLHQFLPLARSLGLPQFLPLARSQTTLRGQKTTSRWSSSWQVTRVKVMKRAKELLGEGWTQTDTAVHLQVKRTSLVKWLRADLGAASFQE